MRTEHGPASGQTPAGRVLPPLPWGVAEIESILPHRYPFLLLDAVTELDPGHGAVGSRVVSASEPCLVGHFPGYPILPGVLVIESLAQLAAVCLLCTPAATGKMVLFGGIDKTRFRVPVRPGAVLRLEIALTGRRSLIGKGAGRAFLEDGRLACETELTFAIVDWPAADGLPTT